MPKTALKDLLNELQDHLETSPEPMSAEERALLMRVHDDIEETLELTSEVPIQRVAETHSLLSDAARELATHPLGATLRRVSELLAGMGI